MSGPTPTPVIDPASPDQAELLLRCLQRARGQLLATLDGLSEHDVRRPLTPTGTTLLGLVKHVATVEAGYLGECVGRPFPEPIAWDTEAAYDDGLDMFAAADETREQLTGFYRRVWEHSDASVRELGLAAPARVPWWPAERRETTLGWLLVHQLDETAHHAGHADILREGLDGATAHGGDGRDPAWWSAHLTRVQAAADAHA